MMKPEIRCTLVKSAAEHFNRGRFSNALVDFTSLVEAFPNEGELRYRLAICHEKLGDAVSALLELEKTLAIESNLLAVELDLGRLLGDSGRPEEAVRVLNSYITKMPNDYQGYVIRGMNFKILGRLNDALEDLSNAIQLNPRLGSLFLWRWEINTRLGNREAADQDLETGRALLAEDKKTAISSS